MTAPPAPETGGGLAALRARIDEIDAAMHRLLIRRSEIIAELIAVKRTGETGAAFRPGREAAMMHALVGRHEGPLPLVTVEHLWREIISTFTWLQAGYTVHVATGDAAETRDVARFYFGFTVPFETAERPADAIAAVEGSVSDLAVLRLGPAETSWWDALGDGERPRIIARLPFIELAGRPVATPAVVVSRPLNDTAANEVAVFAAEFPSDVPAPDAAQLTGFERLAGDAAGRRLLLALAMPATEDDARRQLEAAGAAPVRLRAVGGYSAPVTATASER